MKFPKLPDGPNPTGESQVSALSQTSAPFLTAMGADWITRKKNGYYEVVQRRAELGAWLWGRYNTANDIADQFVPVVRINHDTPSNTAKSRMSVLYTYTPGPFTPVQPYAPFVGDEYVVQIAANAPGWSGSSPMWATMWKITSKDREYLPSEPEATTKKSISYIVETPLGADAAAYSAPVPTGWGGDTARYRWCLPAANGSTHRAVQLVKTGTLTSATVNVMAQLTADLSNIQPSGVFCAGPGKLLSFTFVRTNAVVEKPAILKSDDHGETWTWTEASFMYAHLYLGTSFGWQSADANYARTQCMLTYIGQDKCFFVYPNAYVSGTPPSSGVFSPRLFIGTNGGSWSNVPWPADAWTCGPRFGYEVLDSNTPRIAALSLRSLRFAQLSFGEGCWYMPVKYPEGWKILSTRDFGGSWTISGVVPAIIVPPPVYNAPTSGNTPGLVAEGFVGTVVKPYTDATKPGEILFAGTDATESKIRFFRTDGTFTEFKEIGSVKSAEPLQIQSDYPGFLFTYTGGTKTRAPYVHAGFPGLFDKPS